MSREIVLFGTNNWSDMFFKYFSLEDDTMVVGYTIDSRFITEGVRNGVPVVPFENIEDYFQRDRVEILLCLGYSNMNRLREAKAEQCKKKGYKITGYIHPSAVVLTDKIGDGNIIMEGAIIGCNCNIGNHNVISYGSMIGHNTTLGNNNFIAGGCTTGGEVIVGNNCFLGLNSTIKNGVKINDYALISAAAYVHKDVEEKNVIVPTPSIVLDNKISFDIEIK